jgi:hypothetical protein
VTRENRQRLKALTDQAEAEMLKQFSVLNDKWSKGGGSVSSDGVIGGTFTTSLYLKGVTELVEVRRQLLMLREGGEKGEFQGKSDRGGDKSAA